MAERDATLRYRESAEPVRPSLPELALRGAHRHEPSWRLRGIVLAVLLAALIALAIVLHAA